MFILLFSSDTNLNRKAEKGARFSRAFNNFMALSYQAR